MSVLGNLRVRLTAETEDFRRGMDGAKKNLNSFNRDIENFQAQTVAAAAAAGTALLAVGTAAYMAGSAIDDALDNIRIGTGATGEALAGLEADFNRVFASVPDDAARASQAIADLNTRTGQTGPGLQALAAQVLTLSRLTKSDLGTTIAGTTRLFGDWSVAVDKQAGTLDMLFRASQATGIGVDALAGKMVQFGAPLRQMGFGFAESVALISDWERAGVNAELVLGSLRIGLTKFAKDGKDAPKAIREVIAQISALGPGAAATARAMEVFGSKAGPDMAAAITEGRFAVDALVKTVESGSETISSAAKATDGLSETLARLRNTVTQKLGGMAMPALDRLNELLVQSMQNGSGVQQALYRVTQAITVLSSVALGRMVPAFVASTAAIVAKGVALLVLAGRAGVASLALKGLSTVLAWFGGPWGIAATAVLAGVGLAFLKTGRNARQAAHDAETAADTFRRVLGELDKATLELQYRSNAALTSQAARNRQAAQATLDSLGALKLPETEWANGPADGMVVERVTAHGQAIRAARAQLEQWTAAERKHSQAMLAAGEEINRRNAVLEAVGPPVQIPEVPAPPVDTNASKASGQQAARTLFDALESEWERLRHSVTLTGLQVGGTDAQRLQVEFEHATRMLDIDRQRLQAERAAGIITQQELTDGLRTLEIRRQLATAERDQMSAALTANATRQAGLERQDTLLNDALERERLLGAVALTRLGTAGNHTERLAVQLRTLQSTYELQRAAIVADTRLSDLQRENELYRLDAAHDREQLQLRMNAAAEEELRIIEQQTAARKKSADAQRQLLEGALQLGASAANGASGAQLGSGAGALLGNLVVPGAGGIVGGMLGGMFGGLFDKGQKEAPPVVRQLDAIERAQRDTISTIQAQTESLLNPANRFLNLPTDFSVPSYNPSGSASGGTTVTYGDTHVNVTFTISSSTSPDEIRRYAMEGVSEALDGRNRSWSTKEFV